MTVRDIAVWAFSPSISTIIVTLLVSILLPILIHFYLYRKSRSLAQSVFLLVGPSNAGKTTLLTLLANGSASATQMSQEPQLAQCQLPSTVRTAQDRFRSEHDTSSQVRPTFQLLDTPGHGKLRRHAHNSLATNSDIRGIVFVVDSAAVGSPSGLAEAADFLHDILLILQKRHNQNRTSKTPRAIPVLVATNKQDVFTSLPASMVKTKIEQEIARIRLTKEKSLLDSGVALQDEEGTDEEQNWLGTFGSQTFTFGQMQEHDVQVEVFGGYARSQDGEAVKIDSWLEWIGQHI